mgnify:CR=1 FL=1
MRTVKLDTSSVPAAASATPRAAERASVTACDHGCRAAPVLATADLCRCINSLCATAVAAVAANPRPPSHWALRDADAFHVTPFGHQQQPPPRSQRQPARRRCPNCRRYGRCHRNLHQRTLHGRPPRQRALHRAPPAQLPPPPLLPPSPSRSGINARAAAAPSAAAAAAAPYQPPATAARPRPRPQARSRWGPSSTDAAARRRCCCRRSCSHSCASWHTPKPGPRGPLRT